MLFVCPVLITIYMVQKCLVKINHMKFRDCLVVTFLTAERHSNCNRVRYDIFKISSITDECSLAGYTLKSKHGLNTPKQTKRNLL